MLRSTTIIRELATEPGQNYIDIKTFSMVTSLFVMRWCGSMSRYGVRIVCCALHKFTECFNINITLPRLICKLPDDGRRPKHVGAI